VSQVIYERLRQVAKNHQTTTYGEIAPLGGLDMSLQRDRTEIGRILGEISKNEHEQGRPLLSAIVLRKGGESPGKGFFTLAQELGLMKPQQDKQAFWCQEVEKVFQTWA